MRRWPSPAQGERPQEKLTFTIHNCEKIKNITIPSGVTSIGKYAFGGCTRLLTIYCESTTPPMLYYERYYPTFISTNSEMVIYVPRESLDAYKQYTSGVTGLSERNWFYYNDYLTPYDFE